MAMRATVTKTYYCAWKCIHCGNLHAQAAQMVSVAESSAGFSNTKAAEKASEMASNAVEKNFAKMSSDVNAHKNYLKLTAPGKCPSCGKKQPWQCSTLLRFLASLIIAALSIYLLLPYGRRLGLYLRRSSFLNKVGRFIMDTPQLPAIVIGIILFIVTWRLFGLLHNRIALNKLQENGDPACYPLVVVSPLPEGVDAKDPRLQAAFTLIVNKSSGSFAPFSRT